MAGGIEILYRTITLWFKRCIKYLLEPAISIPNSCILNYSTTAIFADHHARLINFYLIIKTYASFIAYKNVHSILQYYIDTYCSRTCNTSLLEVLDCSKRLHVCSSVLLICTLLQLSQIYFTKMLN